MDEKDKLLTIGQFTALHGINKKTLMWYDEIGLFKPAAIHPENGYYLRAFHKGDLSRLPLRYQEILEFAYGRGLTLSGYSYEKGINETVVDRVETISYKLKFPFSMMCNR